MKKRELTRLALLGMASGMIAVCTGSVEAEEASFDAQYMMAKKGCKGEGGCAGMTAALDKPISSHDADDLDEEEDTHKKASDSSSTTPKKI